MESLLLFGLFAILFLKSFDPSCRIQKFLLPGEERMTAGTDLDTNLLLSAFRIEGGSTGTFDHGIIDFWMNIIFHFKASNFYFTEFSPIFNTFYSFTFYSVSQPSKRFSTRIDLLIHRIEEYSITLRGMHLLQEKLHALDRVHGLKHLSQEPDSIQIIRV
jgi:hypothetical protein